MTGYEGVSAFDLVFQLVPQQVKREAIWLCRADTHTKGTTVYYHVFKEGLHWWKFENGDVIRLKRTTPLHLSDEEEYQIEQSLKWWQRRQWEQMVESAQMARIA